MIAYARKALGKKMLDDILLLLVIEHRRLPRYIIDERNGNISRVSQEESDGVSDALVEGSIVEGLVTSLSSSFINTYKIGRKRVKCIVEDD